MSMWAMSGARLKRDRELFESMPEVERFMKKTFLYLRVPVPEGLDASSTGFLAESVNTEWVSFLPSRIKRAERRLLKRWWRLSKAWVHGEQEKPDA